MLVGDTDFKPHERMWMLYGTSAATVTCTLGLRSAFVSLLLTQAVHMGERLRWGSVPAPGKEMSKEMASGP